MAWVHALRARSTSSSRLASYRADSAAWSAENGGSGWSSARICARALIRAESSSRVKSAGCLLVVMVCPVVCGLWLRRPVGEPDEMSAGAHDNDATRGVALGA